jgi:hypothetical protein
MDPGRTGVEKNLRNMTREAFRKRKAGRKNSRKSMSEKAAGKMRKKKKAAPPGYFLPGPPLIMTIMVHME